ncbi:hypothetical protein ACVWXO_008242 [Bradyrhizobium sp. LM2.7]
MRFKDRYQAHNAEVEMCALFATRNSLKLQEVRIHAHRQRSSEAADPFSLSALKAKETRRGSATSNRHRRPVTSGRTGPKLLGVLQ